MPLISVAHPKPHQHEPTKTPKNAVNRANSMKLNKLQRHIPELTIFSDNGRSVGHSDPSQTNRDLGKRLSRSRISTMITHKA